MSSGVVMTQSPATAFEHVAYFYSGIDQYVAQTSAFIRAGVEAGEPTYVVVSAEKIDRLRAALGSDADTVSFADMSRVGVNPARIIPAWQDFANANADSGRPLRGIGEPIWAERAPEELIECQLHESLLNVAFDAGPPFTLLCPYDVSALPPAVLDEARRSHPRLQAGAASWANDQYRGLDDPVSDFEQPLGPVPPGAQTMVFTSGGLAGVRKLVKEFGETIGMPVDRVADALVSVTELACNSIRHGTGQPTLSAWSDERMLVCQVEDDGRLQAGPLIGRSRPSLDAEGGRGMWLANQLCDLVQVRRFATGTVVRVCLRF